MVKKTISKKLKNGRVTDLYDYWLSTHGKVPPRQEPKLDDWALGVIFCRMDRESGKIKGQKLNFFYHGTVKKFRKGIKQNGLRSAEGAACFTRKIAHALESFALMGNYTMIGNGTIDSEIKKLVEKGIISSKLSEEKKAQAAFRYWCQDNIREKLGLLMIWNPPEKIVALDTKTDKIHKRHFALYSSENNQTAVGRRELASKRGGRVYLNPKFLLAELKPTLELRKAVSRLDKAFARGENTLVKGRKELTAAVQDASLYSRKDYTLKRLVEDITTSIAEGYVLSLVHKVVLSIAEGKTAKERLAQLRDLSIPANYLNDYRNSALKKLASRLK